jgi:hypothetical protein
MKIGAMNFVDAIEKSLPQKGAGFVFSLFLRDFYIISFIAL